MVSLCQEAHNIGLFPFHDDGFYHLAEVVLARFLLYCHYLNVSHQTLLPSLSIH